MANDQITASGEGVRLEQEEFQIVEFAVGEEFYGINVADVREIIRASVGIVPVADVHPSVAGVINLRGKIIPVVNLSKYFQQNVQYDENKSRIIVYENEERQVGFWVTHVTRIHQLKSSQVQPPSELVQSRGKHTIGVTKIENQIVMLVDFKGLVDAVIKFQEHNKSE